MSINAYLTLKNVMSWFRKIASAIKNIIAPEKRYIDENLRREENERLNEQRRLFEERLAAREAEIRERRRRAKVEANLRRFNEMIQREAEAERLREQQLQRERQEREQRERLIAEELLRESRIIREQRIKNEISTNPVSKLVLDLSDIYDLDNISYAQLIDGVMTYRDPEISTNTITRDQLDSVKIKNNTIYNITYVGGDILSKNLNSTTINTRTGSNLSFYVDTHNPSELEKLRVYMIKRYYTIRGDIIKYFTRRATRSKSRENEILNKLNERLIDLDHEYSIWFNEGELLGKPEPVNGGDYLHTGITGTWSDSKDVIKRLSSVSTNYDIEEDKRRSNALILRASLLSLELSMKYGRIIPIHLILDGYNYGYFEDRSLSINSMLVFPPTSVSRISRDELKSGRYFGYWSYELPEILDGVKVNDGFTLNTDTRNICYITSWTYNDNLKKVRRFTALDEAKCYAAMMMTTNTDIKISIENVHKLWVQMAIIYDRDIWCHEYYIDKNGEITYRSMAFPDMNKLKSELNEPIEISVFRIENHIFSINGDTEKCLRYLSSLSSLYQSSDLNIDEKFNNGSMERKVSLDDDGIPEDICRNLSVAIHMDRLLTTDRSYLYDIIKKELEFKEPKKKMKITEDKPIVRLENMTFMSEYRQFSVNKGLPDEDVGKVSRDVGSEITSKLRDIFECIWFDESTHIPSDIPKIEDHYNKIREMRAANSEYYDKIIEAEENGELRLGRALVVVCDDVDTTELYERTMNNIISNPHLRVSIVMRYSRNITSLMMCYTPIPGIIGKGAYKFKYSLRVDIVDQSMMLSGQDMWDLTQPENKGGLEGWMYTLLPSVIDRPLFSCSTIAEWSRVIAKSEGVLVDKDKIKGALNQYVQAAVVGGQQYITSGFDFTAEGDDYMYCLDVNSLYPSMLMKHKMGVGKPKTIKSERQFNKLLKNDKCLVATVNVKFHNTEKNKSPWSPLCARVRDSVGMMSTRMINESTNDLVLSGITIKALIELRDVTIQFRHGVYWHKHTSRVKKHFEKLFEIRSFIHPLLKHIIKKVANSLFGSMISHKRYVTTTYCRNDINSKVTSKYKKIVTGEYSDKSTYSELHKLVSEVDPDDIYEVEDLEDHIRHYYKGMFIGYPKEVVFEKTNEIMREWVNINTDEDRDSFLYKVIKLGESTYTDSEQFKFRKCDDVLSFKRMDAPFDNFDAITHMVAKKSHSSHNHWGVQCLAGSKAEMCRYADIIGHENIKYSDTDSFFVTKKGYLNALAAGIIGTDHGLLKVEHDKITRLIIANHKKYYLEKLVNGKTEVIKKCAGRPSAKMTIKDFLVNDDTYADFLDEECPGFDVDV